MVDHAHAELVPGVHRENVTAVHSTADGAGKNYAACGGCGWHVRPLLGHPDRWHGGFQRQGFAEHSDRGKPADGVVVSRAIEPARGNASGIAIIPERVAIGPASYPAALGLSRPNNAAGVILPDPNTPGGGVGFGPNQSSIPYAVPMVPGTGVGYGPSQNSMPSTPRGGGTP